MVNEKSNSLDQLFLREFNNVLILNALRSSGALSRAALADFLGISRVTVSRAAKDMLASKLIIETVRQVPSSGRPAVLLEIDPSGGGAIGVDIDVDFISIVLTDLLAGILWRRTIPSTPERPEPETIKLAESLVAEAIAEAAARKLRLIGIGVALPGMVDAVAGKLIYAAYLQWSNLPLAARWQDRFGLPVILENEARAAALGEHYFGAGRGVNNMIYISAGRGLGGGIILDGRLLRGKGGLAGQIGHMKLSDNDAICGCGQRGCWEAVAGPEAVLQRLHQEIESTSSDPLALERVEPHTPLSKFTRVVYAAQQGDRLASAALRDMARHLGLGIASLINLFNPQLVVLGGALSPAMPLLQPILTSVIGDNALIQPLAVVRVTESSHGADAAVLGAATLVLDTLLRTPEPGRSAG